MNSIKIWVDFGYAWTPSESEENVFPKKVGDKLQISKNVTIETISEQSADRHGSLYDAVATYLLTFSSGIVASIVANWIYDKLKKSRATGITINYYSLDLKRKELTNLRTKEVKKIKDLPTELRNIIDTDLKLLKRKSDIELERKQCTALTKKGIRCTRGAKEGYDKCHQHFDI